MWPGLRSANFPATHPRAFLALTPKFRGDVGSARAPERLRRSMVQARTSNFGRKRPHSRRHRGALDTLSCHGGGSIQMAKTGSGGADLA